MQAQDLRTRTVSTLLDTLSGSPKPLRKSYYSETTVLERALQPGWMQPFSHPCQGTKHVSKAVVDPPDQDACHLHCGHADKKITWLSPVQMLTHKSVNKRAVLSSGGDLSGSNNQNYLVGLLHFPVRM